MLVLHTLLWLVRVTYDSQLAPHVTLCIAFIHVIVTIVVAALAGLVAIPTPAPSLASIVSLLNKMDKRLQRVEAVIASMQSDLGGLWEGHISNLKDPQEPFDVNVAPLGIY